MRTLIIYDNQGQIFSKIGGSYILPNGGVQFLEIDIPDNKTVNKVDTTLTPHMAILEDVPKSEVDLLKEQINTMQKALDDIVLGGI